MKIRLPVRKPGPPPQRPPKLKLKASVARARRAPIVEEEDFMEEPEPNMRLSHAFVVVLVLHVIAVAGVFAFNSIKAGRAEIFAATKDQPAKTAPAATEDPAAANASNPAPTGNDTTDPSNGGAPSQPTAPEPAQPAIASAPVSAPAQGNAKTHELQPGETLTKVASEYGVTVTELQKANNITDPKKLRPGLVLTIPASTAKVASSAPATVQPVAAKPVAAATSEAATAGTSGVKDSGKIYTVVKGDNPVKIAKHLKVRYADLLALNGNFDPRKLQIGQKLKIPATTAAK
ncbi:MAG TPA: LysM peptidoglycan-binding domain-containing protein [Chthoniobacterales bacterium]|nr:LysM peptidoglycan-binding domain-containing protein [Chthoniobacterales bacterium]